MAQTPSDPDVNAPRLPALRSAVSNGTRAVFGDGRSAGARRYRDLVADFAGEAGGMAALAPSAQQTVRRLAQLSLELELLDAKRAAGATINPVDYTTLTNLQRRLLNDLARIKAGTAPRAQTLAERLAADRNRKLDEAA